MKIEIRLDTTRKPGKLRAVTVATVAGRITMILTAISAVMGTWTRESGLTPDVVATVLVLAYELGRARQR